MSFLWLKLTFHYATERKQMSQPSVSNVYFISGKDSCNGDSGGPLIYREFADDPWYQIGLVSFGTSVCGGKGGVPGVYTRVAEYMDWIESKLRPQILKINWLYLKSIDQPIKGWLAKIVLNFRK